MPADVGFLVVMMLARNPATDTDVTVQVRVLIAPVLIVGIAQAELLAGMKMDALPPGTAIRFLLAQVTVSVL